MKSLRNNAVFMFAVLVIAVTAGQFALRFGAAFLPDGGPLGAVKVVFGGASYAAK